MASANSTPGTRAQLFFVSSEARQAGSTRANARFYVNPQNQALEHWKPLKFQMTYAFGPRNDAVLHVRRAGTTLELPGQFGGANPRFADYASPGGVTKNSIHTMQNATVTDGNYMGQFMQAGGTYWAWGGYQAPAFAANEALSAATLNGVNLPALRYGQNAPTLPEGMQHDNPFNVSAGWGSLAAVSFFGNQTVPTQVFPGGLGPMPFQWQMARIFEACLNDVLWYNGLVTAVHNTTGAGDATAPNAGWPVNTARMPFNCIEPGGHAFCFTPNTSSILAANMAGQFPVAPASWINTAYYNDTLAYGFGFTVPAQYIASSAKDSDGNPVFVVGYGTDWYTFSVQDFEFMVDKPDVAAIYGLVPNKWYTVTGFSNVEQEVVNKPNDGVVAPAPFNQVINLGYGLAEALPFGPPNFSVNISMLEGSDQSTTVGNPAPVTTVAFQVPLTGAAGSEIEYISDTIDWNLLFTQDRLDTLKIWFTDYWGQPMNDESTDPRFNQTAAARAAGGGLVLDPNTTNGANNVPVSSNGTVSNPAPPALFRSSLNYFPTLPPWILEMGFENSLARVPGVKRRAPRGGPFYD